MPGDVDYEQTGHGYSRTRRTDPRIAAQIHAALGDARTVINVGAGAGSYEPADRWVLAVEPAATMRAQRPVGAAPAMRAFAEELPFDDGAFDAAMAILTVHQWSDRPRGIRELLRVSRGPVVVLTFDMVALERFWLHDYGPELTAGDGRRMPTIESLCEMLGEGTRVEQVPIARDCADGFTEAFYARPEAFLDPAVRAGQSVWKFIEEGVHRRIVESLARDLADGRWDVRYGSLRSQDWYLGAMRLVVARG